MTPMLVKNIKWLFDERVKFVNKALNTDDRFTEKVIETIQLNSPTEVEIPDNIQYVESLNL